METERFKSGNCHLSNGNAGRAVDFLAEQRGLIVETYLGRQRSCRPGILAHCDVVAIALAPLDPSSDELCCRPSGKHAESEPATG